MGDMNKTDPSNIEETLAQRSARLEAEAARLRGMPSPVIPEDPLAPEPEAYAAPQPEQPSPETQKVLSEAQARITALEEELARTKDHMLRSVAEAENTRKRALKDREDASKFSIAGFARELLAVSDNLRRALEAIPGELLASEPRLKNLVDGIEATERELLRSFEKNGIKKLNPLGEPFNANFHEVMFEMPAPGSPPGTITQVIEVGYVLHDRLLRPARVGVARNDGNGSAPPSGPGSQIDTQA